MPFFFFDATAKPDPVSTSPPSNTEPATATPVCGSRPPGRSGAFAPPPGAFAPPPGAFAGPRTW